jgi:hypothetical protein
MQAVKIEHIDVEVTPEEEEVWTNFLVKFANIQVREINYETTIPRENKYGLFDSGE